MTNHIFIFLITSVDALLAVSVSVIAGDLLRIPYLLSYGYVYIPPIMTLAYNT